MTFWTDERVDELKALLAEKLSARGISRRLACSRNMVMGKVKRLGLALNGRQGGGDPTVPRAPKPAPKPRLVVDNDKPKPPVLKRSRFTNDIIRGDGTPARPVNMDRMPGDPAPIGKPGEFSGCRWISQEPSAEAVCCGHEQMDGSSYCTTHDERTRSHPTSFRSPEQIESFARFVR